MADGAGVLGQASLLHQRVATGAGWLRFLLVVATYAAVLGGHGMHRLLERHALTLLVSPKEWHSTQDVMLL